MWFHQVIYRTNEIVWFRKRQPIPFEGYKLKRKSRTGILGRSRILFMLFLNRGFQNTQLFVPDMKQPMLEKMGGLYAIE